MRELLRRYLRGYRGRVTVGMAAKVVEVVFDLMTPMIVARMIDVGVAHHDARYVLRMGALLACLACVGYCFTLVCQRMAALVSQGVGTDLRNALFRKTMELSAEDVDRFGTPSLTTRITNDVNQVQVAIALGIRQLIRWPFLAVGSMVAALLIDFKLGCIFLLCTPLIGLVFWFVMSCAVPYFRQMQTRLDRVSLITRESLSGVRVIRAFRREKDEFARFRRAANDQAATAVAAGRLTALLSPATFVVLNAGVVAILWSGAFRVSVGDLTQGEVMAFVNYMTQTLLAVAYVANLVVTFTRGSASTQRIMEVLDASPALAQTEAGRVEPPARGAAPAVSLRDATFCYAGSSQPALAHVTLDVREGETLGIIGGTGSGKSTLVQLLPRLYDATSGSVSVLGRDVREWPLDQLRATVAIVPQRASLMTGTIRSNLTWRKPDATDDELWDALELAQAADFVRAKPAGLDEPVEADGKNFSGGQRQRLTIARALVGSPRVVVLDDSASALDFATDARLRQALASLSGTTTSVVVSQRVSAVMGATKVLVLDHGRVAGIGTHAELLRTCALYREICLSQLSPEEVSA